ncbi:MAG: PAS domain S-box protein, partial [Halomonadaceae bacterium]
MTSPRTPSQSDYRNLLRVNAEELIRHGGAPSIGAGVLGAEALELLYRRASNPNFAADGLKLLHELQTHQVELDLLHEQLQANEHELTKALDYYHALY